MAHVLPGLACRLFRHFAGGTSRTRLWMDIDWKPGKRDGWDIHASWKKGLFSGALYF
jgi:hypothetical protein